MVVISPQRRPSQAPSGGVSARAHTASLVAVFLALALGVLIGGELLHGTVVHDLRSQVRTADHTASAAKAGSAQAADQDRRSAAFAAGQVAALLPGKLTGTGVAVITLPGADPVDVAAAQKAIATAGGHVTGTVALAARFGASSSEQLLTDVASHVPPTGAPLPADPLGAAATALTVALAPGTGVTAVGGSPERTVDAFGAAGLIVGSPVVSESATAVLVVAGPGHDTASVSAGHALAQALTSRAAVADIAGPGPAATSGGVLAALRSDAGITGTAAKISTTDDLDLGQGPAAAVLALAAVKAGHAGAFGEGTGATAPLAP
jgi:hypothetical protein